MAYLPGKSCGMVLPSVSGFCRHCSFGTRCQVAQWLSAHLGYLLLAKWNGCKPAAKSSGWGGDNGTGGRSTYKMLNFVDSAPQDAAGWTRLPLSLNQRGGAKTNWLSRWIREAAHQRQALPVLAPFWHHVLSP